MRVKIIIKCRNTRISKRVCIVARSDNSEGELYTFIDAAAFYKLMSFQRILSGEGLAASPIAQERLLPCVRVAMAFQIVLAIERQGAHVA